MSTRRHQMPFGAELATDGRVRFRLWAPAAERVDLVLLDGTTVRSVQRLCRGADDWFELLTGEAGAGSRYRYRIDGKTEVPDPASRHNPQGVHGPSAVVDPMAFQWNDDDWKGRPWHEAVLYELHVGTFSPEGTFAGVEARLDHLERLGVTVIELMPIADFPGTRNWGYDGVLLFAPAAAYGRPEDLKSLVTAAHQRGISVMLDVVYNHFGPEGNYLGAYAPQFFTERHHTPWGAAINFDGPTSATVRDFYIHNTLYWLEEFHLDGLRFDAVHAILDDSPRNILTDIAAGARAQASRESRHVHLVLENGANQARFLGPPGAPDTFDAQWDDDVHHCLHTILTGESDGYYSDYTDRPHAKLCRSLAEGFVYQGEFSEHEGHERGERSAHLPPTAFVTFLQNHDQIGNRALGERIGQLVSNADALRAATAILLLAPSPPLIFMGEEWAAPEPFPYFCDFEPELAARVREGRKNEFAHFELFRTAGAVDIPDPTGSQALAAARLDWSQLESPPHQAWLEHFRRLLAIRQRDIVPRIAQVSSAHCSQLEDAGALAVDWFLADGSVLHLLANLSDVPVPVIGRAAGRMIFATHPNIRAAATKNELAPWSVTWLLERGDAAG